MPDFNIERAKYDSRTLLTKRRDSWATRHNLAVLNPRPSEAPLIAALSSWLEYAKQHAQRYEALIGHDYVIGRYWQEWGEALRGLLNGELGSLDGGTLDAFIIDTMSSHGIDTSAL